MGLCLLSLDGGGIRALSTLYILKSIMDRLNYERKQNGSAPVKPCDIFDLIGGAGTGGLIAIMLGRLGMDVDECINKYTGLASIIFSKKLKYLPINVTGTIRPQFDSTVLRHAVQEIIMQSDASGDDMLNDGTENRCRTFVCVIDHDTKSIVRLRSYDLHDEMSVRATIFQAALATCATSTLFDPVSVGNRTFADGGLGANNPVEEVEGEAINIWCSGTGADLKPLVKCFVSIGSGNPGQNTFEDNSFQLLSNSLLEIARETEVTEKKFIARWAKEYDEKRYFRFNVDQGLQNTGLEEHKKRGTIEAASELYLNNTVQKLWVRDCIINLRRKQSNTNNMVTGALGLAAAKLTETDRECLQRLRIIDPEDDMRRIEDRKDGLIRDVYEWILHTNEYAAFTTWEGKPGSSPCRLLWVKGYAGTGKTMLLIGIIRELKERKTALSPRTSYFFCQRADEALNNATATIRSLMWLLLIEQPHLMSHLRKKYDTSGVNLFEDGNAFYALSAIFQGMLQDPLLSPVYFLVDALDECNEAAPGLDQLLQFISESLAVSDKVRWLVSSRPEVAVHARLRIQALSKALVELDAQRLEIPVNRFIEHRLDILRSRPGYTQSVIDSLSLEFHERATNIFLWAALVFKELDFVEGWDALDTIKEIPSGLTELYDHMMEKLETGSKINQQRCKNVLGIVLLAYRPLSLLELNVISGFSSLEMTKTVIGKCGSFVTISSEIVSTIHQSAAEYLETNYVSRLQQGEKVQGHAAIIRRSIEVMSGNLGGNIQSFPYDGPVAEHVNPREAESILSMKYCCTFWLHHLCDFRIQSSEDGKKLYEEMAFTFLRKHFLHWVEVLGLLREVSDGTAPIRKLLASDISRPERAFLKDAERFIFRYSSIIEEFPPQTYSAALTFCPSESEIKKDFWDQRRSFIRNLSGNACDGDYCSLTLEGHSDWVISIAFSPGGTMLATASLDTTVRLWDTATGAHKWTLSGHVNGVNSLTFLPNGKALASASFDKTIRLWNPNTGALLQTLKGHTSSVNSIICSPNGRFLASASSDGTVRLWNPSTGLCEHILEGHSNWVKSVAFSPDGKMLASASYDTTVRLWDIESFAHKHILKGHQGPIHSAVFSPHTTGHKTLASASQDGTIRLWNTDTGILTQTLRDVFTNNCSISFSPKGDILASTSSERTVRLWDTFTGTTLVTLEGHGGRVHSVAFSFDGTRLASASDDRTVRLWDMSNIPMGSANVQSDKISSLIFSPDGSCLASILKDMNCIQLWDSTKGAIKQTIDTGLLRKLENIDEVVTFSPDGKFLAWGTISGQVHLLKIGSSICTLESDGSYVSSLAFSPDSRLIAVISGSASLEGEALGVRWHTPNRDVTIQLWDTATSVLGWTFEDSRFFRDSLVFSPDNTVLAVALGDKIQLRDASTGNLNVEINIAIELLSLLGSIGLLAFTPDGTMLAQSELGTEVRLWDTKTGSQIRSFDSERAGGNFLAFSPDGGALAASFHQSTTTSALMIWNVATGKLIQDTDVQLPIKQLRFSANGATLLTDRGVIKTKSNTNCDPATSLELPLWIGEKWISYDEKLLLWLPPEFRTTTGAVSGSTVALAHNSGRLSFIEISRPS